MKKKRLLSVLLLMVMSFNFVEVENKDVTHESVWDMEHEDSDLFMYLPLRATKSEYNGVEYYHLKDNEGSVYISFDELEDGENYIGEIGLYSDKLYSVEKGNFKFTKEYESDFREFEEVDNDIADSIVKDMIIDL